MHFIESDSMGTFGDAAFDNDHALDWAGELERAKKPFVFLEKTLRALLKSAEDSYECERAVAACEIVAALRGYPSRALTENLQVWLEDIRQSPPDSLGALSIEACSKILEESELKELNENDSSWRNGLKRLMARIAKPAKAVAKAKPAAKSGKSTSIQKALKTIKAKGGFVLFEKRLPHSAGTDATADLEFFQSLGELETIKNLFINRTRNAIPKKAFEFLANLKGLENLDLNEARIDDDHLTSLTNLTKLDEIELDETKIGDRGLAHLAGNKNCKTLSLSKTLITDKGIAAIEALDKVEYLRLNDTALTDRCLPIIGRMAKLQVLELNGTQVTGSGFKHLANLNRLYRICLQRTKVVDRWLPDLARLPIKILELSRTPIKGTGLNSLPELDTLSLAECPISDASCKHLSELPIKFLFLSGSAIGDRAMQYLAACKKLDNLDVSKTNVGDDGVKSLCQSKSLRHVNLVSTQITDEGVKCLAEQRQITSIALGDTRITLAGLEAFIGNPVVTQISLNQNDFSYAAGVAVLTKIRAKQPKGKQVLSIW